ncbi:hypothetical protein [Candidatus Mycolicibacterium alkanivorans]|uniref:Secreted protein n=1 Tax=Candidatus Mycolicibacterium alkanivorans TaxID=2954114 RepID=A0ABS9YS92_9MYCO|nr:hypothetical protein [Candidatus Mycolicibacterium alkanivorans]MCI4674027.1 hypothetical protein [Candidatus Mycolicibacterium alkanivorans]
MTARGRAGGAARYLLIVGLLALLGLPTTAAPAAAGEPSSAPFLHVRIDAVTPDLVTTTSEPTLSVTGTITNVGDRPVRDVVARLEHAVAVTSSSGLRTTLDGSTDAYQPVGDFTNIAAEIPRGRAVGFTFSYPLRGDAVPSLGVDKPGVYPLLVNVNGTPDFGEAARLDDARFLLPVLGVPADPANSTGDAVADVVAPDTAKPVAVTMLWPLADKPRLAPGVPGGTTPVRLMNDDLAVSLASGGRLDTLLSAADFATSPAVDPDGQVARALCLTIDPDLLVTVNAMTAGYVVADSPDGMGTASHPGTGQAAATAWLDRLRALAKRICVAPTPYAQADLGALRRVGDGGLAAAATTNAGKVIDQILGVTATRGVTILGDGPLTAPALDLLNGQGATVAVAAASITAQDSSTGEPMIADLTPHRLSHQVVVAPFDPAVGAALAGVGTDPDLPTYVDPSLTVPLNHDSTIARRQDALAAMLWRALRPETEPRTQILLPPLKWSPQPDDAQAMLTALATTIRSGLAAPRPLPALVSETAAMPPGENPGPPSPDDVRGRFDDDVVETIGGQADRLRGLTAALTTDPRTGLTGQQYTAPLREDMLRALSQTESPRTRNDLARQRLAVVGRTITDLFGAVTIVNPGGSYTLATEHSPLPLAVRNDLAVPIRVWLQVDAPPGMKVTDLGEQEVPPGYLPLRVPIEVHFTQRVAVDVTLRTPDGLQLGEPVRLSVHSNAYGKVLFAITLSGAVVLALLVGRRLYHRFRGEPDPADLDRPRRPHPTGGEE